MSCVVSSGAIGSGDGVLVVSTGGVEGGVGVGLAGEGVGRGCVAVGDGTGTGVSESRGVAVVTAGGVGVRAVVGEGGGVTVSAGVAGVGLAHAACAASVASTASMAAYLLIIRTGRSRKRGGCGRQSSVWGESAPLSIRRPRAMIQPRPKCRAGGYFMATEREKALELALSQIERQVGKGSIMKLGEVGERLAVAAIPTGSLSLDVALGIGGVPRGRVTEIFGAESAGKSTLAHHIMAEAQIMGGTAAYIDAENALDPTYASNLGVNLGELLVSQPDTAEQALEIAEYLVRSGAVDVVVIDSVAALVPRAELEGDMGDSHMGLQARIMSQALRKLAAAINRSHTVVIFINQLREKIGVVFGNPEVTPGGRALKFYSSVRIDLRRIDSIKQASQVIGTRVRARVVKNKVAPPFRVAEFDIMFNRGISKEGDILDLGTNSGAITKAGSFYSYGDLRLGQGRESAKEFLSLHKDVSADVEQQIRSSMTAGGASQPSEEPVAVEAE